MAYESKSYELLRYMAKNKIAIEINLVSNEFILKSKKTAILFRYTEHLGSHCDQYRRRRDTKNEHDRAVCFIG
jgi:hypothetical protein